MFPPEAMNRMVREDPAALETVAIWGGRELLEQALPVKRLRNDLTVLPSPGSSWLEFRLVKYDNLPILIRNHGDARFPKSWGYP